jgi:hypothetical protein
MRFLRLKDYYGLIKQDNLNVIIEDAAGNPEERFLLEVEAAALTELQSYLRHRYDVATIFAPINAWSLTVTYNEGSIVYEVSTNLTYRSKVDANLGNILSDGSSWEVVADPRDAQLKIYLIDLTLYHIHSRINPRNVPEIRLNRRDEAVKWLGLISDGKITVDLPEADTENAQGYNITFGGEAKRINSY